MPARILDGTALALTLKERVKQEVRALNEKGIFPGLGAVLVGENPASNVYVSRKEAACKEVGIQSKKVLLPENVSEQELLEAVAKLNADPRVHGILVQLPLPAHINGHKIMQSILPEKDVDGLHAYNQAQLYAGKNALVPCTPQGILHLIHETKIPLQGKHAVVLGRSLIVGKPTAMLLLQENATVAICHSKTPDLRAYTCQADVLIAAIGKPRFITRDMVKPGAIVIDVGITRSPENKLMGDVDFERVKEVAGFITPVPGGVGPMTVACLMENTLLACKNQTLLQKPSRKIVIGVAGSTKGTDMQALIDGIESKSLNAQIGLVCSDKQDAYILERARKHALPAEFLNPKAFSSREAFDMEMAQRLRAARVEIVLLIGYKRIVSKPLLDAFPNRVWNIHPSLLPAFNGKFDADVHQEVLNAGVKLTGATLHIVTEDVDKGPILLQQAVQIEENESVDSLKQKVQAAEMEMLVRAIREYSQGTLAPFKQESPAMERIQSEALQ
ncbi:MAG: bifunctional methylenetetrahydrofolate dehydrogenase/methenyltetrahydrofolate cyclohydrolase FolD [Candidatus Diapherotrites archaeon]|nr:bifunctional methylenetetrahydrofolate dehydrogenase/methenyltetrahydrofolate cyclohydrolase FolD [Candidatus Diapherotrites archaeon]